MNSSSTPEEPAPAAGATLLLVEDEAAVRRMLVDLLSGRGFRVLDAADAETALLRADDCAPAGLRLLVTDLRLPGMSGLELAGRLRARFPGLEVIFMSGFADDILSEHSRPGFACHMLEKPFRTARLVELVTELLA